MKLKLFGKDLFELTKNGSNPKSVGLYNNGIDRLKESEFLIDFYKDTGLNRGRSTALWGELVESSMNFRTASNTLTESSAKKRGRPAKNPIPPVPAAPEKTPKEVYNLKLLNDDSFVLNVDEKYVDEQLTTFKEKLGMIKTQEFDMDRGTIEIGSIVSRFENRKKYPDFKDFYEEFPYTTTTKVNELVKNHDYLKVGEVSQFLADMPKEAVDAMKRYTDNTKKLSGKKPVFYIIANKKDFEKTEKRRDPILLAQSPFGHVWQILGAWDEEMLLLEEL